MTAIHLIVLKCSSGRALIFGDLGIIRGVDPGPEAYRSIVDGFGQYTRARWDGKIGSNEDLQRARVREEQEVREWLPPALGSDRYGGLPEGPVFGATGFFRTERREGRWWLVTPEGHGFFSLGIDVVSPEVGATFVEGREFMFTELPGPSDPLATHYGYADEHQDLPTPVAQALRPQAEFRLLRRQSAAEIRQITCRFGAARRSSGFVPRASTRSATGASPDCLSVTRCPMSCRFTYTEILRGSGAARIGGERCRIPSIRRSPSQ